MTARRITFAQALSQYSLAPTLSAPADAFDSLVAGLTTTVPIEDCEPCALAAAAPPAPPPAPTGDAPRWEGPIAFEGELTGDGRLIEPGALTWEVPFTLRYVKEDVGLHDGAVAVGTCDFVERRDGGVIWGAGTFDVGSPEGTEAFRVVGNEVVNGVSVDLDDVSFEIRVKQELLQDEDGMLLPLFLRSNTTAHAADQAPTEDTPTPAKGQMPDGSECSCVEGDPDYDPDCECPPAEETQSSEPPVDAEGRVTVMEMHSDDEVRVTTSARVRSATVVAIPAFIGARIHLAEGTAAPEGLPQNIAASSRPVTSLADRRPPASWFADPKLSEPTPLVVSDDGRVYGHIAAWNVCHTSHTAQGQCVLAPHSRTGYANFRTGSVLTRDGSTVATGRLTIDTTHAEEHLSAAATMAHYENTGRAVADVACGEDAFGIWVAGAMRPWATEKDRYTLRASPISGDWRRLGGSLELVAALGVNVAGFPIPRPHGLVAGGYMQSLMAGGMLAPRQVRPPGTEGAFSTSELRYLKRLADRERLAEQADLRRRVTASALKMRVRRATTAR